MYKLLEPFVRFLLLFGSEFVAIDQNGTLQIAVVCFDHLVDFRLGILLRFQPEHPMAMILIFSSQFIAHHLPHQFIWRPLGRLCPRRAQKDKNGEDRDGDYRDFEVSDIQHHCDSAYSPLENYANGSESRSQSLRAGIGKMPRHRRTRGLKR